MGKMSCLLWFFGVGVGGCFVEELGGLWGEVCCVVFCGGEGVLEGCGWGFILQSVSKKTT